MLREPHYSSTIHLLSRHPCQVDLWSLGVILFELYTGQPPFYTNSIYTLIKQIVRESVQYPASMSADFRSFLQVRRVLGLMCWRFSAHSVGCRAWKCIRNHKALSPKLKMPGFAGEAALQEAGLAGTAAPPLCERAPERRGGDPVDRRAAGAAR